MTVAANLEVIGKRYRLDTMLGRGGMGTVYRAFDRLTGSTVALKRVTAPAESLIFTSHADSDADFRVALANEFKTLASLRHPHIISVLDYGFDNEQQPFFTMDYLDQAETIFDAGISQSVEQQVNLLIQLLEAIAYLHRRGHLHRDLKPANVLVANDQVKVLDFGLSIARNESAPSASGTFAYMAPEVATEVSPDERADLYATGVIAYEMLAGRHPFNTASISKLIDEILYKPADLKPIEVADKRLAPIVERLLAKNRDDRYTSANEVIQAFSNALGLEMPHETTATRESLLQAANFVGRNTEFDKLSGMLAQARQGHGSSWLVGGESGVGKSRLLSELRTRALVDGVLVLRGQAITENARPYQMWRESLRWLAMINNITDLQASVLKSIIPDIGDLLERKVDDAPELDPEAVQERQLNVIEELFQQLRQPTMLILEDLHWAANESAALLGRLNRTVSSLPLFIISSYRADEYPDLPARFPEMQNMILKPLSKESISELSASMLGTTGSQPQVVDLLARETSGNILALIEVVRTLAEEAGQLDRIGLMTIPQKLFAGGVFQLVRRRVAQLPTDVRSLLYTAAVAGRQLDLTLLQHIAPQMSMERWLEQCTDINLLEIEDGKWRFAHDKLREGLIDGLSEDERKSMHRQIAEAYEAIYPNNRDFIPMLAYHWGQAGNDEKEGRYSALAGEQAIEGGAIAQAAQYIRRAIELQKHKLTPTELSELERQLAFALLHMGQLTESSQHFSKSLRLANQPDILNKPAMQVSMLWHLLRQVGHRFWPARLKSPDEQTKKRSLRLSRLYSDLGAYAFFAAQTDVLLYAMLGDLNFSEKAGASSNPAISYASMCIGAGIVPLHKVSRLYYRLAMEGMKAINQPMTTIDVIQRLTIYDVGAGNLDTALKQISDAIAIAEEIGARRRMEDALESAGLITWDMGRFTDSLDYMTKLYVSAVKHSDTLHTIWGLCGQQSAHFGLGNIRDAIRYGEQARELIEANNSTVVTISCYGQLAVNCARDGQYDLAHKYADVSLDRMVKDPRPVGASQLDGYVGTAEAYWLLLKRALVDTKEQKELLARYKDTLKYLGILSKVFSIGIAIENQYKGLLALYEGNPSKATELWQKGLIEARNHKIRYLEAVLCRLIGKDSNLDSETRNQHLKQAREIFQQTQSKYDLELC